MSVYFTYVFIRASETVRSNMTAIAVGCVNSCELKLTCYQCQMPHPLPYSYIFYKNQIIEKKIKQSVYDH